MPQVPRYDSPQIGQAAVSNAKFSTDTSAETFGGGRVAGQLEDATQGTLGKVDGLIADEKQRADEVANTSNLKQLSDLQTKVQVAATQMRGKDALGAPDAVAQQWTDGVEQIKKNAVNQEQNAFLDHLSAQSYDSLNKSVQMHVASEMKSYDDSETHGAIESSRNAATLNAFDDQRVAQEVKNQSIVREAWAKRNGIPTDSETYKNIITQDLSATHSSVIGAKLNAGQDQDAQSYFEANKGQMSAPDQLANQKKIEDGLVISQGKNAYGQVAGMRLADGTPDEGRMRASVMKLDLPDQQKEKVWDFVKAKVNEDAHNQTKQQAASDRDFMNNLMQARQDNVPLEEAMKLVTNYGRDTYDQAVKNQAVQKLYGPPGDSDVKVKYALWQGTQDGTVNPQDIDKAMQDGKITATDWDSARKELYKVQIEGHDPVMKLTNSKITSLAKAQFGGDQEQMAEYMNAVNLKALNKSPDEKFKIAKDELESSAEYKHNWLGFQFGHETNYETDSKTNSANALAFGKAKEDLGPDVVRAIGNGVAQTSKDKFAPAHIEQFASDLGGYDAIKPGTPNNAAIKYLMSKGYPVVPQNVKWAADKLKTAGGQ